ncbi:DUF2809 domain-containing protein [Streptomyces sp. NPDC006283]|uniref:ribosomal maturation YjgA family protein n=1 Tax=Streptomyces sp. NPDC006283 TaxID=3156741 RepID=UPI0033BCE090
MISRGVGGFSRTRAAAAAAAVVTVVAGLGIRALVDGCVAKYAGDALYAVLILALVVFVAPRSRPVAAAGVALGFSWAVELLQLTGVPAELGRRSAIAHLVLGSTFNAPDLVWYAVGAALGWCVHGLLVRRSGRPAVSSRSDLARREGLARRGV